MFVTPSTPGLAETTRQADTLWKAACSLGYPSAVWRLPHSNKINLLVSIQPHIQKRKVDLEALPSCFVLHPFKKETDEEAFVLEGSLIFTVTDSGKAELSTNHLGEEHPVVKRFLDVAADLQSRTDLKTTWQGLSPLPQVSGDAAEQFKDKVTKAIGAIQSGMFDKIVLSRTKTYSYPEEFDAFEAFRKLHRAYASAFVSLVNLPELGEMWLGATPETLVSLNTTGTFKTTSLAGTQVAGQAQPREEDIRNVRWGQKEIQEQALVSRYIVECFKKIRLREYCEIGPKTVRAGNLFHLRTDFTVNTQEVNFPELGTVMLDLLHPTSAVCGTPKEPALHYINATEGYDRSFYSGYLGPVQVGGESMLFVNLRTLRLSNGTATLFAGAGITEDSDPQREWEETEMKCETLLQVLR
jgi:isochorismate synthase